MAEPTETGQIRFGGFRLDQVSGELHRDDGAAKPVRLPPQPTRLLSLLIRRRPTIVSRDEIAGLLWPQVAVDVEQSIHAYIRQIRVALGDSATAPRFVETIPRRGYRFIGDVEEQTGSGQAVVRRRSIRVAVVASVVAVVAIAVALTARMTPLGSPSVAGAASMRVAVMPFEPTGGGGVLEPGNGMAETIVRILAAGDPPALQVIGPTTTQRYDGNPQRIRALIEELEIDLLVNARQTASGERVLIELIRGADGAHVWVRYLDELPTNRDAATIIAEAVMEQADS